MQRISIYLFRPVKAIIILTLDFTLLFKSRILSYLLLASMEHVSAQLPSVRNCPEREREKEDKRGENIMKCQQLKWITVQYQSRHSEKESEGEYSAVGECACVCVMPMLLNCSFCFSISGEVLSWLISSAVDVWRDDVLGKWTVVVSLKRVYLAHSETHTQIYSHSGISAVCAHLVASGGAITDAHSLSEVSVDGLPSQSSPSVHLSSPLSAG